MGLTFGFIHKIDHVSFVCNLGSANIIIFCESEDVDEIGKVDMEKDQMITPVFAER